MKKQKSTKNKAVFSQKQTGILNKKRIVLLGSLLFIGVGAFVVIFSQQNDPRFVFNPDTYSGLLGRQVAASKTPTWRDEFNGNSLSYATDGGGGTWRTKGYEAEGGYLGKGYKDYAGSSWNATQAQIKKYDLVSVGGGVLTLKTKRNPGLSETKARWIGPYLVTNHRNNLTWKYGYFEWRMSLPNTARGMFPALWLFNNVAGRSNGYQGAEIDAFEIFGDRSGRPWKAGMHFKPRALNGSHDKTAVTSNGDTSGWHRYGIKWTADEITYYRDGAVMARVTGAAAAWFRQADLGIRINYAMDPEWDEKKPGDKPNISTAKDPSVGTTPTMKVDYVRYYKQMPSLPGGSGDPL